MPAVDQPPVDADDESPDPSSWAGSIGPATRTGLPSVRVASLLPMSTSSDGSIGTHFSPPLRPTLEYCVLRLRLVTSIHSPSAAPVWISVRSAWPSTYRQTKDLPPAWVRAYLGRASTPGRSTVTSP